MSALEALVLAGKGLNAFSVLLLQFCICYCFQPIRLLDPLLPSTNFTHMHSGFGQYQIVATFYFPSYTQLLTALSILKTCGRSEVRV
jgi:hypothetical protein